MSRINQMQLRVGWWGFPWGLLFTPVQLGRNIVGLVRSPDATKPSTQLEAMVRTMMVAQALRRQGNAQDAS